MTVGVVHHLESIQIQIQHGQMIAALACVLHGLLQARGQHQPIRAVGQCVVMRDVFKLSLLFLELGDVRKQQDVIADLPTFVASHADGHQHRKCLAGFVPAPYLARPVALAVQASVDLLVKVGILQVRSQDAQVLADDFCGLVATDAGEGLVDFDDVLLLVGNHDAFLCMRENDSCPAQFFFGLVVRDDQTGEVGTVFDQGQLFVARSSWLVVVEREGALYAPFCVFEWIRPARHKLGLLRQFTIVCPERMGANVFHDDWAASVRGRTA